MGVIADVFFYALHVLSLSWSVHFIIIHSQDCPPLATLNVVLTFSRGAVREINQWSVWEGEPTAIDSSTIVEIV